MGKTTLFDPSYEKRKEPLMRQLLGRLRPIYTDVELAALRIDSIQPGILAQRSGRGFVNRDLLETVLGNLLECAAPGSHNAVEPHQQVPSLAQALGQMVDQLYAMIAQSLLAAGEEKALEERSVRSAFALLWELPRFKERARWNRFASLRDPAVWDAYLLHCCKLSQEQLFQLDVGQYVEMAIAQRDPQIYQEQLEQLHCSFIFDYQMQLVMSTYPGWRVLFYHDIAHALTRSEALEDTPSLAREPIPLLPRAISQLGGRYYQADLHPETQIGDANFLDHPHRGITTGQTGIIGRGCHLLPCTLGGLSTRVHSRHPVIGDYASIGTDAGLFGPVILGDEAVVGANTEIYGQVYIGKACHIGTSVVIGTIKEGKLRPGAIRFGEGVRVGSGTIIENDCEEELLIPVGRDIPARSHVVNSGDGSPIFIGG